LIFGSGELCTKGRPADSDLAPVISDASAVIADFGEHDRGAGIGRSGKLVMIW
jgi:hypothetical protein